ncbi:MAG: MATE family efflux transporter [Atopobiaceae bacterium]|nr:MATE family efflux transporter [Atopobiaceae bacterium]
MDAKEIAQYEKLVLTPVGPLISRLAIPTVISMLTAMIYNLVDAFFVGQIGTSASAAIGIMVSIQGVFQAIGFMYGHGAGSLISRHLGKGDREAAHRYVSTSFVWAIGTTALISAAGIVFLDPFMRILGSTETILPYSRIYGFYMLISGPALAASCVLNNVMRYEGKAALAMVGLVSGGVINMVLDPILMFTLGMGIRGAGLSTAIAEYTSFVILLVMFLSGRTVSRLSLKAVSRRFSTIVDVIRNGIPSLVRQSLNSLAVMVLNLSAGPYGDAAIAAMTIVGRVSMVIAAVMIGIGQGLQPVAAYNYGAEKFRRVQQSVMFTWRLGEAIVLIGAIACFVWAGPIVSFFRDDPEVARIGIVAMRIQCVGLALAPITIVMSMVLQSVGKPREASVMAMMRNGLFYIPALLIAPRFLGLLGIQSAQAIADVIAFVTTAPFVVSFLRQTPNENRHAPIDDEYTRAKAA